MELLLLLTTTVCLITTKMSLVAGHARLMDPPARNSMWRYGFGTQIEYNDNKLYCGNITVFESRCGVCGDKLWVKQKQMEVGAGSRTSQRTISRHYKMGQEMSIQVEVTANHWGRFETYLCPNNDPNREVNQSCFNKYPLYVVGTQKEVHYKIGNDFRKWGVFQYKVQLPPNVTCSNCVVQWSYYSGRAWDKCPDGTEAIGCGDSAVFRNCADVVISKEGPVDSLKNNSTKYEGEDATNLQEAGQTSPTMTTTSSPPLRPLSPDTNSLQPSGGEDDYNELPKLPTPVRAQVCISTPMFRKLFEADDWCMQKCLSYPSICPPSMCSCPNTCDAMGAMAGKAGADTWCQAYCIVYPYKCHEDERCKCYKAEDESALYTKPFNIEDTPVLDYD